MADVWAFSGCRCTSPGPLEAPLSSRRTGVRGVAPFAHRCYGAVVPSELIGREEELDAALTAFVTLPAVVALEGEAGIGKTSVWRAALEELEAGATVVPSARPAEAETHLSYVGLA